MNADRLLKLADLLDTVPPERFDYGRWMGEDWDGQTPLLGCGTTACALGWATAIPEFGLSAVVKGDTVAITDAAGLELVAEGCCERATDQSACRVFGISPGEYMHLFLPTREEDKATPEQVADKIRSFVHAEGVPEDSE